MAGNQAEFRERISTAFSGWAQFTIPGRIQGGVDGQVYLRLEEQLGAL